MISRNKIIILKNKDTLKFDDFNFKCSIGKKGLTVNKKEGDFKTPVGLFNLGPLFYRKDRIEKPDTRLACKKITSTMGWCNDVYNKRKYNKLINLKEGIKHEKLYRSDYKYNLMIPISFNTKSRVLGKGSAIFIHLTKNYKKTAGCIALKEKDLLILLKLINKKTKILIN
tara:strand:- start:1085 stop:1594 length:510 start_codon:yes stop_codon:yes gene_type:complete